MSITVNKLIKSGRRKVRRPISFLNRNPQMAITVKSVLTISPRKPNSASRKIAKGRTSTGRNITAALRGGRALESVQVHGVVLVQGKGPKDLPSVNYRVIRGCRDCRGEVGRINRRSVCGTRKTK